MTAPSHRVQPRLLLPLFKGDPIFIIAREVLNDWSDFSPRWEDPELCVEYGFFTKCDDADAFIDTLWEKKIETARKRHEQAQAGEQSAHRARQAQAECLLADYEVLVAAGRGRGTRPTVPGPWVPTEFDPEKAKKSMQATENWVVEEIAPHKETS